MPAPDQFKLTKSYAPIVLKINPNSSHAGLRTTVHLKSFNKDITHVMLINAFKYSVLIFMLLCKDPMRELMLIHVLVPRNTILK